MYYLKIDLSDPIFFNVHYSDLALGSLHYVKQMIRQIQLASALCLGARNLIFKISIIVHVLLLLL